MDKCLVVNLFGAPSAGKSTGAAYIFSRLKMLGVNCELVTEFAKAKTWENGNDVLNDQLYVFAKQAHSLYRLKDKVDVIITDSPLLLSLVYGQPHYPHFDELVKSVFYEYENVNYYLMRTKTYSRVGRSQTEVESNEIGDAILDMLQATGNDFYCRKGNEAGYKEIVDEICDRIGIAAAT